MPLNAVDFRNKLEEKWAQRTSRVENTRPSDYIPSLKLMIVCKCPRCETEHEMLMRWTGRGKPRVFCPTCRPAVSTYADNAIAITSMNRGRRGMHRDES